MDDEPAPPCARCGGITQVIWSPAFAAHFCAQCRWEVTEQHLKTPVTILRMDGT
jgi:hypothetical protein